MLLLGKNKDLHVCFSHLSVIMELAMSPKRVERGEILFAFGIDPNIKGARSRYLALFLDHLKSLLIRRKLINEGPGA